MDTDAGPSPTQVTFSYAHHRGGRAEAGAGGEHRGVWLPARGVPAVPRVPRPGSRQWRAQPSLLTQSTENKAAIQGTFSELTSEKLLTSSHTG